MEKALKIGALVKTRSYLSIGEIGKVTEIVYSEKEIQYKVILPSGPMYFYEHELVELTGPYQAIKEIEEKEKI